MRFDIPVAPDGPEGQEWLREELAKPEYQSAKPTWFDIASKAVQDWFSSLFNGPAGDGRPILALIIVVVVLAVIVGSFLLFGRPRLNRRSAARRPVFGADDSRTADELRASAAAAARTADWVLAIEEQFRAIALGLDERTLVTVTPGTTATEFVARAAVVAPLETELLQEAARTFDDVRYLGRAGTEVGYQHLVALDQRLQQVRPLTPVVAG